MPDSPIGAVVRQNVMAVLGQNGRTERSLYSRLGIPRRRFLDQFEDSRPAPRLDIVVKMAAELGVPSWRLLVRDGESPPELTGTDPDHRTVRHFVRCAVGHFATSCEIPTRPRRGEPALNFVVRQNVAIGLWQCWKTEADLYQDLHVHRATWHAWFRRKTGIAMENLWRIAEALEMEPWEMVAPVRSGNA